MKISNYGQRSKHFKMSASATPINSALNNILNNEMTTEMGARYSNLERIEVMMDECMEWAAYKPYQEKSGS